MWRCTEGNGYLGLKENAEKTQNNSKYQAEYRTLWKSQKEVTKSAWEELFNILNKYQVWCCTSLVPGSSRQTNAEGSLSLRPASSTE